VRLTRFAIALGSNRRHGRYGAPQHIIEAALTVLDMPVLARSRVILTHPVGPGKRVYANAAAIIESDLTPDALLCHLKRIEVAFGRRSCQRWGDRVLDLDIILWSAGIWATPTATIPHARFRERRFVLNPFAEIAPDWRDPVTNRTVRHLKARLDRKLPRN
jgi:2-amino-4-hydroxy-6-hydroxymethyldihydropteridine diphosphokinase